MFEAEFWRIHSMSSICSTSLQLMNSSMSLLLHYVMLFSFLIKLTSLILLHGVKLRTHHRLGMISYLVQEGRLALAMMQAHHSTCSRALSSGSKSFWNIQAAERCKIWTSTSQHYSMGSCKEHSQAHSEGFFYQILLEFHFIIRLALMVKLACLCTIVCEVYICLQFADLALFAYGMVAV